MGLERMLLLVLYGYFLFLMGTFCSLWSDNVPNSTNYFIFPRQKTKKDSFRKNQVFHTKAILFF